jgi:hypothetical protein
MYLLAVRLRRGRDHDDSHQSTVSASGSPGVLKCAISGERPLRTNVREHRDEN